MLILLTAPGCASFPGRPFPVREGTGWTATPLDGFLARPGCRFGGGSSSECERGCLVRVTVHEDDVLESEHEHRTGGMGRTTLVRRADGSISVRSIVRRGDARLDVLLDWPEGGSVEAETILAAMARPFVHAPPDGARLTRTYQQRLADGVYTLHETAREGFERIERYERDDGLQQWSRAVSDQRSTEARAAVSGQTRRVAIVHREGVWQSQTVWTEQLDSRSRLVRRHRSVTIPDRAQESAVELEYDAEGRITVLLHIVGRQPSRIQVDYDSEGNLRRVERDGRNEYRRSRYRPLRDERDRLIGYAWTTSEGDEQLTVELDEHDRVVGLRDSRRYGIAIRGVRNAAGQLVSEVAEAVGPDGIATRSLERVYDDAGRLLRSILQMGRRPGVDSPVEFSRRSVVEYAYSGSCRPELQLGEEFDHQPRLDRPVELLR